MMVLKKKELVAGMLVILIGVAGYLNWSYQDTIRVNDSDSYIETGKKLGEAQFVSNVEEVTDENTEEAEETASDAANVEEVKDTDGNYFENARLEREEARSKALEILNQTAANESFDEDVRKKAGDKIIQTADNVEKETEIESLAQSKGYDLVCAYISDDVANISVKKDGFSENDVTVLCEIVASQTHMPMNCIRIIEVK